MSLVHPDDQREIADALNTLPSEATGRHCTIRIRHGEGGWITVDLYAQIDSDSAELIISVLDVSDATARAAALDHRLRAEDLLRRLALGFIDVPASQLELAITQAVGDLARAPGG
jgi:hypothetical protein